VTTKSNEQPFDWDALKARTGLTWTALAEALGIKYQTLGIIRRGTRAPGKTLRILAETMLSAPEPKP